MPFACGVILTLVSAWTAAAFLDVKTGTLHNLKPTEPIPAYIGAPKDWTLRTWHECWGPGVRYDLVSECMWVGSTLGASEFTAPNRTMLRMTAGFPLPNMRWTPYAAGDLPESGSQNPWHVGLDLPGKQLIGQRVERALPLHPLLWPTLINVLAYSVLCFLVGTGVAAVRLARRRRRGLCAACGYAVGSLPKCPECGLAASPAAGPPPPTAGSAQPPPRPT